MPERSIRVTIGIITFNRPQGLRELLSKLTTLAFPRFNVPEITIVVVDNDARGSAEPICREMASSGLKIEYVVEQNRGIPFARNAVLRRARRISDYLVFIDDDEVPVDTWLDELLWVQKQHSADVVAGPVIPVFEMRPPAWIETGGFFDRPRPRTGTRLRYVASGNVLLTSEVLDQTGLNFDERFALSGGEDTHFFMRLARLGTKMVWADEAVVSETVPSSRANMKWLIKRSFRLGSTMSRCERFMGFSFGLGILRFTKGFLRVVQGVVLIPVSVFLGKAALVKALQSVGRGSGSLVGLFGGRYDEYRHTHGR